MVYMEPSGLGITPFIDCWIKKLPHVMFKTKKKKKLKYFYFIFTQKFDLFKVCEDHTEEISNLAYTLILPGLEFLRENLTEIVTSVDCGLVQAYFNLMNYQIGCVKNPDPKAFPGKVFYRTFFL